MQIIAMAAFEPDYSTTQMSCVLVKELAKSTRKVHRDSNMNITSWYIQKVSENNNVFAVHVNSLKKKCVMVQTRKTTERAAEQMAVMNCPCWE